jgi:MoaA/NifB/PqqE/SkfB family radical SAM enzyme
MKPVYSFPSIIQIQTQTGCNARCIFCPNGKTSKKLSMGKMDRDLFYKIINEAVKYPVQRISPYLMNEPLLDKRLPELISYISKKKNPKTRIKINSNASCLDEELGAKLIESGLDRLHFSFHGIKKDTYEKTMLGMNWEKNLNRINQFLDLKQRMKAKKPRIKITMIHTTAIDKELKEIKSYWNSRGITVNVHALENRSHASVSQKSLNIQPMKSLSDCERLMQQAYILFNGDCVLCCVDWERSTILGNVNSQSLYQVWNDKPYTEFRRNYLAGNVQGTLCEGCEIQDEIDFSYQPKFSTLYKILRKN